MLHDTGAGRNWPQQALELSLRKINYPRPQNVILLETHCLDFIGFLIFQKNIM